jgi:hypothetical protein
VSALCVGLAFGAVFAQEGEEQGPIPSVEQAAEYEQPAADEEVPTPVAEVAPVNEAPEKVRPAEKPAKPVRQVNGDIVPNIGFRAGLGVSSFAGHLAPRAPLSEAQAKLSYLYNEEAGIQDGRIAIRLWGGVSASVGVTVAWDLTQLVDLGVPYEIVTELQYTLYTGYGSRSYQYSDETGLDYNGWPVLYDAMVQLHAVELPILARFRYETYYLEIGPQFGVNTYNRVRAGVEATKPTTKHFSFGPAIGFGVDLDGVIAGVRWQMDVLEYAKYTKGHPWALHATVSVYPF